jgi:predicted nucleic acid-binding protein
LKVADASVAIAAASPWHEGHEAAFDALSTGRPGIVAHAAVETYSALTRMPEPARMHPAEALLFLEDWFEDRWLGLPAAAQRLLLGRLAELGVHGGATYDALIGATAAAEGATLVTADRRALATYALVGTDVELVG